jgi:formate-dependent nitrite reductase membrane component NrfD
VKQRVPDAASERRLEEIRREAELHGRVEAKGVHPPGAPMPPGASATSDTPSATTGYYGLPLLKAPVWTWEIPLYFFVGGTAGAAAALGAAAQLTGADRELVRDARWIACAGATLSAPLLISDLGRPERFLNMMRVFKPRSPMSVGAWTLAAFGASSTAAALAEELGRRRRWAKPQPPSSSTSTSPAPECRPLERRRTDLSVRVIGDLAGLGAAASGLGMATYTGVLLGATAIPVWTKHVKTLPIHFGASAVASAASILELLGHEEPALNALAFVSAAFELYTGLQIERDSTVASEPLRHGSTGITTRIGGLFSGPLPLILRLLGTRSRRARRAAAVSALLGSLITRFAWVEAGRESAGDPRTAE